MLFRLSTLVAVLSGVVACAYVGEISALVAVVASVGIAVGMTFSSMTRQHPWPGVKLLLAVAVVGVFVEFVVQIFGAAHTGELSSIEVPLASLFTWVQVVHAFDVPARRDLLFSVAAAAALVTVASAQAVSVGFLGFVAIWFVASIVGLACSWRSMAGGRWRLPAGGLLGATMLIVTIALLLEVVLPLPRASQQITLPSALTSYLPLGTGGGLTQGGSHPAEPAQAGRPGGAIGIGGFVGMAGPLDTAVRASLGNEVVMRVRAGRPGYFLGSTYDRWNGQSWTEVCPAGSSSETLESGSPFQLPSVSGGAVQPNIQTFYVEQNLPNLLFGTSVPQQIYFPAHGLIVACDHSLRSTIAMTAGTVYTVVSSDDETPISQLIHDDRPEPDGPAMSSYLQLPHPYPRVEGLARSIVRSAHATSVAADVLALEGWMGRHTRYSTDIPPLPPGQDAVDEFLFGNRTGYCEQISTALAVMLRTLGIPAREATGYIPGSFDPLSDLYTIEAKDAHAWVQVYVPGHDWQSFDPTAFVPLAPPNPGAVLLSDIGHGLERLPWIPLGSTGFVAAAATLAWFLVRRRRRRPLTWAGLVALGLERAGSGAGLDRRPAETLGEYAQRLAGAAARNGHPPMPEVNEAVRVVEESAYGQAAGVSPPPQSQAAAEHVLQDLARSLGRRRRLGSQPS